MILILDGVRGRVLATIPFPNLQTAYAKKNHQDAIACTVENRQDAMLGKTSNERATMEVQKSYAYHDSIKSVSKCTHYNGNNHVVDT